MRRENVVWIRWHVGCWIVLFKNRWYMVSQRSQDSWVTMNQLTHLDRHPIDPTQNTWIFLKAGLARCLHRPGHVRMSSSQSKSKPEKKRWVWCPRPRTPLVLRNWVLNHFRSAIKVIFGEVKRKTFPEDPRNQISLLRLKTVLCPRALAGRFCIWLGEAEESIRVFPASEQLKHKNSPKENPRGFCSMISTKEIASKKSMNVMVDFWKTHHFVKIRRLGSGNRPSNGSMDSFSTKAPALLFANNLSTDEQNKNKNHTATRQETPTSTNFAKLIIHSAAIRNAYHKPLAPSTHPRLPLLLKKPRTRQSPGRDQLCFVDLKRKHTTNGFAGGFSIAND